MKDTELWLLHSKYGDRETLHLLPKIIKKKKTQQNKTEKTFQFYLEERGCGMKNQKELILENMITSLGMCLDDTVQTVRATQHFHHKVKLPTLHHCLDLRKRKTQHELFFYFFVMVLSW